MLCCMAQTNHYPAAFVKVAMLASGVPHLAERYQIQIHV